MFVFNIHLAKQSVKCFCSILLNGYGTPTNHAECAIFNLADSTVSSGVQVM